MYMTRKLAKISVGHTELSEFKKAAETLSRTLSENDVQVAPYHNSNLPVFSNLDKNRQINSLEQINFYKKSLQMASESAAISEKQSLWSSLKLLGLRPTSDILDIVNSDDSVEAYDLGGIQFWRNFKFFEVCSYTLEEMFSIPWHERYLRDPEASKQTDEIVMKIMSGQITQTYNCDIKNVIVERFSESKFVIDVRHTHVSPLYDQWNAVAGFIVVSKVKLLGTQSPTVSPLASV